MRRGTRSRIPRRGCNRRAYVEANRAHDDKGAEELARALRAANVIATAADVEAYRER